MNFSRLLGCLCIVALAMTGGATAQVSYTGEGGCNKGLLWPFSRSPGDCLTDSERASGMTGTYRGSEVESVAPEAAAAPSALAQQPAAQSGISANEQSAPAANSNSTQEVSNPVATQSAGAQSVAAQEDGETGGGVVPAASDRTEYLGEGGCTKGVFWPFVRRAGDCLTDAEIRSGRNGTYQE